jgi:C-terminal processing protease CtpA/Prc
MDQDRSMLCSQSENEALQRGDVIKKIDDYDARDVRHVDAQNLLQNSETIKLVIERSAPSSVAASRINTNITTTTSRLPTIFKSIIGDGAAVTSLSECNIIYFYYYAIL